jgi:hypothetical protein
MQNTNDDLHLDSLPAVPDTFGLSRLATILWEQEGVIALWLGGSYAAATNDRYSDIDLRMCVSAESAAIWENPDFTMLFDGALVGRLCARFGPIVMHQIVLANGRMIDLSIQTVDHPPTRDYVRIIGCRSPEFRRLLEGVEPLVGEPPAPADSATVCDVVTAFWINSEKTTKVLHRNLDGIARIGIEFERAAILRLWHILATGNDTGSRGGTIHSLTSTVRQVEAMLGDRANELLGLPLRNRAEVCHAVEANRNEVARVGRLLSERLGFEYPSRLENTVRQVWAEFLASASLGAIEHTG